MTFEQFIKRSDDYTNLRFQYGNQLFVKENDEYKIQAVRLAHEVWENLYGNLQVKWREINQLKAELAQANSKIKEMVEVVDGAKYRRDVYLQDVNIDSLHRSIHKIRGEE